MKDFVFLLGRPGCGKSFIYETIVSSLKETGKVKNVKRVDDFPFLKEILDKDTEFKRHVRKEGGFEVTDWSIIDEVLQLIDERLPEIKKDCDVVFVEFARDKYLKAFKNFSPDILSRSLILYIFSPFEVCLERNRRRFEKARENNLDDHIVPTDLMYSYYKNDDIEEIYLKEPQKLAQLMPCDWIVVDNSKDSVSHLMGQFNKVIEKIIAG